MKNLLSLKAGLVNMNVTIVDSEPSVVSLIDDLEHLPTQPPSLYVDIEGVNLSRHGSVSIVQLFVLPKNHIFLIDVFVLCEKAFNTANRSGTNLRSILESALVPKVFFDVRNDSDALFAHFQISLQGIHDVQLLQVATRIYSKDLVVGLAKCIERDAQLTPEASTAWEATKQRGLSHFSPESGGSYQVFNTRPMLPDIIDYCTQDVVYLPRLWKIYNQKISAKWARKVKEKTSERVRISQTASYEPHGRDKAWSPWANPAKIGLDHRPSRTKSGGSEKKAILTVAQKAATEAAKKTAPTQRKGKTKPQPSTERAEPQLSASIAASEAAKIAPNTAAELERPLSEIGIPTIMKTKPDGNSLKKTDPDPHPAMTPSTWTCTSCCLEMQEGKRENHLAGKQHAAGLTKWTCITCGREMEKKQKEEHLAGKQHIARAKRSACAPSEAAGKTAMATEKAPRKTPVTIKSPPMGDAVTNPTPRQSRPGRAKATGTNRRNTQTAVPVFPQTGREYPPDYLFSGFAGSVSPRNRRYDTGFSLADADLDYGICDKDCGWCGHCMDSVNF